MKALKFLLLFIALTSFFSAYPKYGLPWPILHWDWSLIPYQQENFLNTLHFPSNFKFGVADSAYQVEGTVYYDAEGNERESENSWSVWEGYLNEDGTPRQKAGQACDRWCKYKEDIQLMKDAGFTTYRFSIDWSKVEPREGEFDKEVMQHYIDVVDEIIEAGIEPVVCLFHHVWPWWFDQLGNFEKKGNNKYFVRFATHVFRKLRTSVRNWMTLNEPVGYAMQAYFRGKYPPFKKSLKLTGIAVKNMLDAHVAIYHRFHEQDEQYQDNVPPLQITYAKVIQHLDPYRFWHPFEKVVAALFDRLMNKVDIDYFKTGIYNWGFPCWSMMYEENEQAKGALDYIGVNYYSHTNLRMFYRLKDILGPSVHDYEQTADSGQIIYPEGLYRAIQRVSVLGIPIYVTENGLDDRDDTKKEVFINQHLYAVSKAIEDGYDVRGYYYWTFMDTCGWCNRFAGKYGLYRVNFDTQERILRPRARPFIKFVQNHKRLLNEMY